MMRTRICTFACLVLAGVLLALGAPALAGIDRTYKKCGAVTIEGAQAWLKADRISCASAKSVARKFAAGSRPSGFSCRAGKEGRKRAGSCRRSSDDAFLKYYPKT